MFNLIKFNNLRRVIKMNNDERIKVSIRVRPVLAKEILQEGVVSTNGPKIKIGKENRFYEGTYDKIFDQKSTQIELFDYVKNDISQLFNGINCSLFTYGQTNSGKTFTMFGSEWTGGFKDGSVDFTFNPFSQANGLVPRTITHIFSELQESKNSTVSCSYIQIYNEKIYDLLLDVR
jgi:hypothetical protein